jgi:hypothetical protein
MARFVDLLIVAGMAILSVRLFASGLHRRYRVFFFYLIFATLRSAFSPVSTSRSNRLPVYLGVDGALEWLFMSWWCWRFMPLVLQDYRGLSTAGRWALIVAVLVALLASAISLMAPSQLTTQGHLMRYYYVAERAVYFSLVVFLLSILGFPHAVPHHSEPQHHRPQYGVFRLFSW